MRWIDAAAITDKILYGPLPSDDIVATRGVHLRPRPSTPVDAPPIDLDDLGFRLSSLVKKLESRRREYGEDVAEEWLIGRTPIEVRELRPSREEKVAALLESSTPLEQLTAYVEAPIEQNPTHAASKPTMQTLGNARISPLHEHGRLNTDIGRSNDLEAKDMTTDRAKSLKGPSNEGMDSTKNVKKRHFSTVDEKGSFDNPVQRPRKKARGNNFFTRRQVAVKGETAGRAKVRSVAKDVQVK